MVVAYAGWLTAPSATHGRLDVLELLTTVASVPMAVGIGAVVGRLIPATVAPIAGAVTPYVIYMCMVYADVYSNQVVFTDILWVDQVDRTYLRLPATLLLGRAIFWAAAGAALLGWLLRAKRAAYGLTLAAGFAAAGVLLTAGVRADAPDEYAALCFDGPPRVRRPRSAVSTCPA
ncbi:hypothetical protein [Rhizomonospora bruguierae]|uniref:hypothetical protein n=1 Tax=Rhizomonospora bruguierae TaxID=1581705 RepID=UPI001BCEE809|nr:hypothetical protein [Micromonospora sp. NBRC 107566]